NGVDNLSFSRAGTAGGPTTINAGVLDVYLRGGSDADNINVDLAGGGFVLDGTLRIREDGGLGNDHLTAAVDGQATSATPNLDVRLNGGQGADVLNAAINNNGPNTPDNYGAAGTVILDGSFDAGDSCTVSGNGLVHKRNCES